MALGKTGTDGNVGLREIADCDAKLRQHRAALEAGADPVLATSWMKETQAKRAAAEARLEKPVTRRRMTRDEITTLVAELGDIVQVLRDADPADSVEVYRRLGVKLTYHSQGRRVQAEARPNSIMYVGACPRGDLNTETREISPVRGNNAVRIAGETPRPPGIHVLLLRPRVCAPAVLPAEPHGCHAGL